MKLPFLVSLFLFLSANRVTAQIQPNLYDTIVVNSVLNNYTVAPPFDTSFVKEVVITINDTSAFQDLSAELSIKNSIDWTIIKTDTLQKPLASVLTCNVPLCIYRRDSNKWVLNLGYLSLFKRYRIELFFNGTSNWVYEF